jgi:predicted alpha/beta-hydrolase family hydrolase
MDFLYDGPDDATVTLLLAHGAGAAMDSPWMTDVATLLAARAIRVARFEFGYMATRREGTRRPPPRAEAVAPEYLAAVDQVDAVGRLLIGGKSMGGRVASLVADELTAAGRIDGLVCLSYPFHPAQRPAQLRTAHLATLTTRTLICQGERDPLGSLDEVRGYDLSPAITTIWLGDGDHDLRPRTGLTGLRLRDNLAEAADAVAAFCLACDTPLPAGRDD